MTKNEVNVSVAAVVQILEDWIAHNGPITGEYLQTDFHMMFHGDLEAIRVGAYPLPYSGNDDE